MINESKNNLKKSKTLTEDELYNMYLSQVETLKIKGQQKKWSDGRTRSGQIHI